ncbi:LOW QUALITY PROTEIN: Uncharacterized protein BM_BM626 [Brugia malayi]|uniref:Uncharacterized protein n=1 Tax=Brugia malayi TaxID=6279 RepID=A0A4E9F1R9_BRUMA|nr:LOW QUALITY PROTEIN: Uncharacterized protein BM_BM626 [Brugia malayi]VIO90624.1 LOW QUALITY PROTEIN: Uncharacterized protein BM_BM626 [Brugia malayi]
MKNSRKAIKQRNGNSNDISVRITNTNAEISSDRSQQSISKNLSLTQEKSDSEQTQSTDEMESKTMNLTEISSKADEIISKISTKDILKTSKQQILNSQLKEKKFSKKKFRDDKLNVINHQIPSNLSVRTIGNQVLPDFSQIEIAPLFAKHDDLKPIAQNLSRRKVKSVESLKAEKINRSETNRLPRRKNSEKTTAQKYFFPSCMEYTFLRLIALILLFCAWFIVYAFPCLRFTYHIPIIKGEMIESVAEKIPLKKTCRIMPHWWNDQKTFVRRIIETTQEDLMEEAMFDLVEISIFCVFSVIEFYMSSGAEIRAIMDSIVERKEKVYNICIDVKIEAYGFLSSGCIFLFLVFLFAIDLIILLKNAEEVESRKYLQMAACLHYDRPLKCMSKSVLEGVFIESTPNRKKK